MCPLPVLLDGPGRRGGPWWLWLVGSRPFGAHGAPSLCWSWPWPAWRGRCGGWLVVQDHSGGMGLLPCAGRGPGRRGGAAAVGGWWFRPIRCAWGSFLVLVVALAGVAGPLRWVAGGSGPFGAHGAPSLCWSWPWPAWRGRCGGWLVVQAHSVRMGLLPCAGRGPGRRGGAGAAGGMGVLTTLGGRG